MHCPTLADLPVPPPGRHGWPWDEESPRLPDRSPEGTPWPRISLVTPSFNQGSYIEETIRSVLLQGHPEIEYFVIDGGSTDCTLHVVKRYEPWLTGWVSEQDRGQSHAINKGFARCTGDLITFLGSDDVYLPGALVDAGRRWREAKDRGAVAGGFHFTDENSRPDAQYHAPRLPHEGPIDLTTVRPEDWRLHQVSVLYARHALDRVGKCVLEQLHYTMDRELLYRVCREYPILLVDRPYALFRRHENSKSVSIALPFAREMASLYLALAPDDGDPAKRRIRERWARYHLASGYLKCARAARSRGHAASALLRALVCRPPLVLTIGYHKRWLKHVAIGPRHRR